jgi:hypothetical protein
VGFADSRFCLITMVLTLAVRTTIAEQCCPHLDRDAIATGAQKPIMEVT